MRTLVYSKTVLNTSKLKRKISAKANASDKFQSFFCDGNTVYLYFDDSLDTLGIEEVDMAMADFDNTLESIDQANIAIESAKNFAIQLIKDFTSENIIMGITQLGMTGYVMDTLEPVEKCLNSGSLYEALNRAALIVYPNPDPEIDGYKSYFINEERMRVFTNNIRAYLGLALVE